VHAIVLPEPALDCPDNVSLSKLLSAVVWLPLKIDWALDSTDGHSVVPIAGIESIPHYGIGEVGCLLSRIWYDRVSVWRLGMRVQMQCQQKVGELRKMKDFFWLSSPGLITTPGVYYSSSYSLYALARL